MQVDQGEIQGIVLGSFSGYPLVRHLIFSGEDPAALRAFVRALQASILFGTREPPIALGWVLNLSFAAPALGALVAPDIYKRLESAFRDGPEIAARDEVGASVSTGWWEGQFATRQASVFAHLHAVSTDQIELGTERILAAAGHAGLTELKARASAERLDGRFITRGPGGGGRVHFGYVDGLSKSQIAWSDPPVPTAPVNFRSVVIGYNEDAFPSAPATGPAAALFRNSSYLVFRWVYQDVAGFERFLDDVAGQLYPAETPSHAREIVAAKMMGRWRDGTPLILSPQAPDPSRAMDDFDYAGDPQGKLCPVSSHIRVMNPRNQPLSGFAATTGVPQIVRRGMSYGPQLATRLDDGVDRGIYGMFICASIREQYMRLAAWGQRNNFSPVFPPHGRDQDALVGNRGVPGATRRFRIAGSAGDGTIRNLPDFVHTKGSQFLILPSRTTLDRIIA